MRENCRREHAQKLSEPCDSLYKHLHTIDETLVLFVMEFAIITLRELTHV